LFIAHGDSEQWHWRKYAACVLEPLMVAKRRGGFTVIELLVVVVVVAVLLAVAVPSFREQLARRTLEGAANELSSDLQYARSQSVSRNADVLLSTTATGYTICCDAAAANYKTITLDSTLNITPGVTVTYSALRAMANVATLNLASNRTDGSLRLTTNVMGRVSLCSPGGSLKGYAAC
jgi:type IV fimbrial biogenesis protein FimT